MERATHSEHVSYATAHQPKEIKEEVYDLLHKLYADKLVLYFDNLIKLHWVWQRRRRWPILKDARFWVQAHLRDVSSDDYDAKAYAALMLIDQQTGWCCQWNVNPGLFETGYRQARRGLNGISRLDPESDGFNRTTISHSGCTSQEIPCVPFKRLEFPFMENGCRVTTYRWRPDGLLDASDVEVGSEDSGVIVLEGRLDALLFKDATAKTAKRRMECERRKVEESRQGGACSQTCGCFMPCPIDDEYVD